jgi:tRNA-Thr(GGU) m(6)t(6)A37 methyltransferase TsaA
MESKIQFKQIGIIHSPLITIENMPIQPLNGEAIKATVELFPDYLVGLLDLEGFSHIILIYFFHKISEPKLLVKPFMDDQIHGIFATRSPVRPNPIGISTVRLKSVENNILYIENVDILDETPLLDIKPFFPQFDNRTAERIGWLAGKENIYNIKSDNRFK